VIFAFDKFELDGERQELWRERKLVKIEAVVIRLLIVLVRNAGKLVTKDELVDEVWEGRAVADNVITVSMARLRKTLVDKRGDREFVATVYGRGYRFVRPVQVRDRASWEPAIEVAALLSPAPPFLGRESVLRRLREAVSQARIGHGSICVLMGEAGIGKTRLVEMLESELGGPNLQLAWGYCREAGDTPPLGPFRQVLYEIANSASAYTTPDEALELATETVMAEDDSARRRSVEKVIRALTLSARRAPLVIMLDDLHRADEASIELLSLLVDQVARSNILVVATLRTASGGKPPRPETKLPYLLGHRNCLRLTLERLSEQDVRAYVATLLDDGEGRLGGAIFAKSEGNPFFMAELCRQVSNSEAPDQEALTLPVAALDLVRQHVAKLDAEARGVLSAAAVIGRSFELSLLAPLTEREVSALVTSLDDAIAAEVIVAAPHSRTAFAFGHELMRTVLYEALAPAERRSWHLRVARALESRAALGERLPASDLAYHFHAALPQSDLRKTVHYCGKAALEAAAVFATVEVVRYARQALEALELTDKPSVRLRMRLLFFIAVCARGHDGAGFVRSVNELLYIARDAGHGDMLARAATLLNWHPGFKPLAGVSSALHHALTLLSEEELGMRGVALCALACAAPECFDATRSQALIAEGIPLIRKSGSRAARYAGLLCQLYVIGGPDQQELAGQVQEELEKLAQDNPKRVPVLAIDLAFYRAVAALTRGDQPSLRAAMQRAAIHAREVNHREMLWHAERLRALSEFNAGARSESIASLRSLHAHARREALLNTEPFCAFDRSVVCQDFASGAAPDELTLQALGYDPSEPPGIWAMKVRALAAAGLRDQARVTLHAVAPDALLKLPCDSHHLGTLGHLARAAIALGERDYVRALYPMLSRYPRHFAGHISFLCEGAVPHLLGLLAAAEGKRDVAREHVQRGVVMSEAAGFHTLVEEGRTLLRQ
jgi:DNA-binding winged helix-turn-helix (wHTH) protein